MGDGGTCRQGVCCGKGGVGHKQNKSKKLCYSENTMSKKSTIDRLRKFQGLPTPKEEEVLDILPEGVFVGVVRDGRRYVVVELSAVNGKPEIVRHEPCQFGIAMAKAIDRLEELGYILHNQPWTKEQLKWRLPPGEI